MPIVDGITAIGILAASNPEIAVIALTTFQEPQQVTAALAAGARGYLVKDVEPEVLAARLRTAFDLYALGESIRCAQLRREHPDATDAEEA